MCEINTFRRIVGARKYAVRVVLCPYDITIGIGAVQLRAVFIALSFGKADDLLKLAAIVFYIRKFYLLRQFFFRDILSHLLIGVLPYKGCAGTCPAKTKIKVRSSVVFNLLRFTPLSISEDTVIQCCLIGQISALVIVQPNHQLCRP